MGFNAGINHAQATDPAFGMGAKGYGKRYGVEFLDQTSSRFFSGFLYPALLREDPCYYRLGHRSAKKRLLHAMGHVVIAYSDNGRRMFNFSEWMGTSISVALAATYPPQPTTRLRTRGAGSELFGSHRHGI